VPTSPDPLRNWDHPATILGVTIGLRFSQSIGRIR